MKRSTSLGWLLSILLILAGITAQTHILESDLVPGKRIRTTWIDENRDTDELYRMYLGESPIMELRQDGSHRVYIHADGVFWRRRISVVRTLHRSCVTTCWIIWDRLLPFWTKPA